MNKITFKPTRLNESNYVPVMDYEYKDTLNLDPDMVVGLRAAGITDVESELIELLVDGFRQSLKNSLGDELRSRGFKI